MRPLGQRRQVLLFLLAILVPCVVLAALSLRMLGQERELIEKHRGEERRRAVDQVARALAARLERARPVLEASIVDGKLWLPWERDAAARQCAELLRRPEFNARVDDGERQEFAAGKLEGAIRSYGEALRAARHPVQAAYARLLRARALDKAGRRDQAAGDFRVLLALDGGLVDEEGIPIRLYAAERLLSAAPEREAVLGVIRSSLDQPSLPPAAWYLLSNLAQKLAQPDARVPQRIREIEQALALQNDYPRVVPPRGAWTLYGDDPWLVGAGDGKVVAVRAREPLAALEAEWRRRASDLRFLTAREPGGEMLGENFPGLKAALALPQDAALLRRDEIQRYFYYAALLALLGATMFGAWLLWRDLRREVRLAEVRSQFVSSVSHELKTPLTAIRMFAETMQMGRSLDARAQSEYLDTIVSECERLSRLVDDVLHFSKIERGKKTYQFRRVRLEEVISAAARALQYPLSQQGFDLRVEIEEDLPPCRGDRDALEQAVLNLLSNAMKYSGDARAIGLELRKDGDGAVIRVTDHGIGIPTGEQERIFEKFYRVPTRENQLIPGTGLGLTLVEHIVKAHGGRVGVHSTPGQGSTFLIYLPLEVRT